MLAVSCMPIKHITPSGCITWKVGNSLHREDGPAFIYKGREEWWLHGKTHRIGGPAVEDIDGYLRWYKHGKLHREDGPAVVNPVGKNYWHVNTRQYSEEEYNLLMFMKCDII